MLTAAAALGSVSGQTPTVHQLQFPAKGTRSLSRVPNVHPPWRAEGLGPTLLPSWALLSARLTVWPMTSPEALECPFQGPFELASGIFTLSKFPKHPLKSQLKSTKLAVAHMA